MPGAQLEGQDCAFCYKSKIHQPLCQINLTSIKKLIILGRRVKLPLLFDKGHRLMKHNELNQLNMAARTRRNTTRLMIWTIFWVISIAFLSLGPQLIWDFNMAITAAAILFNLAAGFKMIMVNIDHLSGLDELQRRIQLNAMGISLGVGLVAGVFYETLEDIKVITFEPEISHLIIVMALVYMISVFLGNRKYS